MVSSYVLGFAMSGITELIILEVEKNPILYNKQLPEYKDSTKKRHIWREIAARVGWTDKEVELRWKNLRDCMAKYKKKQITESGDGAKYVKEYKYAKLLDFLTPFFAERSTASNLDSAELESQVKIEDYCSDSQCQEDEFTQITAGEECSTVFHANQFDSTGSTCKNSKRKKRKHEEIDQTMIEHINHKTVSPLKTAEDDVDLFLQSIAPAIKQLPPLQRADVKYKIHGIVHEAETSALTAALNQPTEQSSASAYDNTNGYPYTNW